MAETDNRRSSWQRSKRAVAAIAVVLVVWLATSWLMTGILWDGAFPTMKFRLRLIDREGQPVSGATLKVRGEDRDLREVTDYPVTSLFTKPTSDEKGWIEFYHVREGLEFGGHSWKPFFLFDAGYSEPRFWLEFHLEGKMLGECSYNDLVNTWWDTPEVERKESWPRQDAEAYVTDSYYLREQSITLTGR